MKRVLYFTGGVGLVLLGLLVVLAAWILPPTYAAAALVHLPGEAISFASAAESLQSDSLLSEVATRLRLGRKWGEKFKEGELPAPVTVVLLRKRLVIHEKAPGLLEIKVSSDDPKEAATIANNIATVFCQWIKLTSDASPTPANPDKRASVLETATPNLRRTNPPGPTILISCMVAAVPFMAGFWLLTAGIRRHP